MRNCLKYILYAFSAALLIAVVTSCRDDFSGNEDYTEFNPGSSEICFVSDPMQQYNVTSRSSDPKLDEEKKIHNINIFFFTEDGMYLEGSYLTGNKNAPDKGGYYKTGTGVQVLKIDNDYIYTDEAITVYAVANVDTLFSNTNKDGRPWVLECIVESKGVSYKQALESIVYMPDWGSSVSVGIPSTGIPMVGFKDIRFQGSNTTPVEDRIIEMRSLMVRVDVNLQITSEHGTTQYPSFLLSDWKILNLPKQVALTEQSGETGAGWTNGWKQDEITFTRSMNFVNGEGMKNLCTFYMFENVQNPEWIKDEGEEWYNESLPVGSPGSSDDLYPPEIDSGKEQRYKPYLANSNATAIVLNGLYYTYNAQAGNTGSTYQVRYTLYLGGDHTDDFKLQRNRQYKNNITIKGLLGMSSSPGEYTFDARVNVTEKDNDFYVSILRERNHDAHPCVTPMDIYMFKENEGKDVRMEVYVKGVGADGKPNDEIPDWIRMECIPAANMAAGTVPDELKSVCFEWKYPPKDSNHDNVADPSWHAGNGKRLYFTNDLMSVLSDKVTLETHRDRVYLYIDENLNESIEPLTGQREAFVVMDYYEDNVKKGEKTILIAQYPFLKVQVYGRNGTVRNENQKYLDKEEAEAMFGSYVGDGVIYMEQIEEYLEHYDPLDTYNTGLKYKGLVWGESMPLNLPKNNQLDWEDEEGKTYVIKTFDPWDNYIFGLDYTEYIISGLGQSKIDLNAKPRSAVEYCWNRNKRNSEGIVTNPKYFLPGIRQMEDALTTYYNSFTEFQDNFYWSSSIAFKVESKWVWDIYPFKGHYEFYNVEETNYARATKIVNGNYVGSTPGDPNEPGYKQRSDIYRIRAFRSDLNK